MTRSYKIFIAMCVGALSVVPAVVLAYREGPPVRHSGVPGETNCTACHIGSPVNSSGNVALTFSGGTTYTPGQKQTITVTITDTGTPARGAYGFQLTARLASNLLRGQAGTFSSLSGATQVLCGNDNPRPAGGCAASDPLEFIEHTSQGVNTTGRFEVEWTAPATDVGNIRFFVAGNAANNSRTESGDRIYTADATLTPAAAGGPRPTITQGGVVNAGSGEARIASGTWISIFGTNLAEAAREIGGSDIENNRLPTRLGDVSVEIQGTPGFLSFISPGQINVQVPDSSDTGNVRVEVIRGSQRSEVATVNKDRFSPAFLPFIDSAGKRYIAAQHANDFSIVGKTGLFQGLNSTPARPDEIILLYATGFGPTDPAVPAGTRVAAAARLVNDVRIFFGDTPAEVSYAGVTPNTPGLNQFNVKVPATAPDGDVPVRAEVGGLRTQENIFITVQR